MMPFFSLKTIARMATVIICLLFAIGARPADAAVIHAASCSQSHVQAAINLASSGDTVEVPAGTCTWTTGVTINKGITFKGAGVDQTVILDEFAQAALVVDTEMGESYRITGFTFQRGATQKSGGLLSVITVHGATNTFRVDHNKFDHQQPNVAVQRAPTIGFAAESCIYGVIDSNTILLGPGVANGLLFFHHGSCWGAQYGDGPWANEALWGTEKFIFVEDNTISIDASSLGGASLIADMQHGARIVFRFNQILNANGGAATHGTESGGRSRSPRAIENYHNTYIREPGSTSQVGGNHRGGGFMAHNNTHTGPIGMWAIRNNRSSGNMGGWPASDGSSLFDLNDGVIYESGTHTGPNGSSTLIDSTKNWTTNRWMEGGFSVRNITKQNGTYITSNTATQLVAASGTGNVTFDTGNTYQIIRATKVIDAVGRGKGVLLLPVNAPRANALPAGVTWVVQEEEPSYQFNNRLNGQIVTTLPGVAKLVDGKHTNLNNVLTPHVIQNRDIFEHSPNFIGASGVGVGPIAARPETCSPNVGYWATDEGEWNSLNRGPEGQLYKCTASRTWSLYYTPYPYPHPLRGVTFQITGLYETSLGAAQSVTLHGGGKVTEFVDGRASGLPTLFESILRLTPAAPMALPALGSRMNEPVEFRVLDADAERSGEYSRGSVGLFGLVLLIIATVRGFGSWRVCGKNVPGSAP